MPLEHPDSLNHTFKNERKQQKKSTNEWTGDISWNIHKCASKEPRIFQNLCPIQRLPSIAVYFYLLLCVYIV